jgi:hypothetical protein
MMLEFPVKRGTTFVYFTNRQRAVNNRHGSFERAGRMLRAFGYGMMQRSRVNPDSYMHWVHLEPLKEGVLKPVRYGKDGLTIGKLMSVARLAEPQIKMKVGDDLWYTSPIDVKAQVPDRIEFFNFPGRGDGSIDFEVYGITKECEMEPSYGVTAGFR